MISMYRAFVPSQCEVVSRVFNQDCCAHRDSFACDRPFHSESALSAYGISYSVRTDLNYGALISELRAGHGVILILSNFGSNTGHAIVAYGTFSKKGTDYVEVFDPIFGRASWTYFDLTHVQPWESWVVTN